MRVWQIYPGIITSISKVANFLKIKVIWDIFHIEI